jgi:hypothetical protein
MRVQTKVLLLVIVISVAFLVIGFEVAERFGLFLGLISAIGFISLFFTSGNRISLTFYQTTIQRGNDTWGVYNILKEQCPKVGVAIPEFHVHHHSGDYAYVVLSLFDKNMICLSEGLLNRLNVRELQIILAYQLQYLKMTQGMWFVFVHRIAECLFSLGLYADQILLLGQKKNPPRFFQRVFALISNSLVQLKFNTSFFRQLDQDILDLTKEREQIGDLFWRMRGCQKTHPLFLLACSKHQFILNPEMSDTKFSKRLQNIVGYYPV